MTKYAIDSNVYIDALRHPADLLLLQEFLHTALPQTYLSAIVHHELLAAASTTRQFALLEDDFVAPFRRRGRLTVPSAAAWQEAGRLRGAHRLPASPTLLNDLLLALSCRELGITVISRDADFRQVARLAPGLRVAAPFPKLSTGPDPGA